MTTSFSFAIGAALLISSPFFADAQTPKSSSDTPAPDSVVALQAGYPAIGEPAKILSNDADALALFNKINSSGLAGLSIPVKLPGKNAVITGEEYDTAGDPDCWWSSTLCTEPKQSYLSPDISTCSPASSWGLSFDDGPHPDHDFFYDFLQENQQLASMFFIGANVLQFPLAAQRALTDGHEICVHTWSHASLTGVSNEDVFAELYYTIKAIKQIVGVTPKCWRPPFGDADDRVRTIASQLGLESNMWLEDTFDWQVSTLGAATVNQNYDDIFGNFSAGGPKAGQGALVLTHEVNNQTMQLFIDHYPQITQTFKHVVPIATCSNITSIYGEGNYTYPTFDQYTSGQKVLSNQTSVVSSSLPVINVGRGSASSNSTQDAPVGSTGGTGNATTDPTPANSTASASASAALGTATANATSGGPALANVGGSNAASGNITGSNAAGGNITGSNAAGGNSTGPKNVTGTSTTMSLSAGRASATGAANTNTNTNTSNDSNNDTTSGAGMLKGSVTVLLPLLAVFTL